jgi:phosphohistidine phosphatase
MRQLILLRHAKAATDSDTGEDIDRPLASRGCGDAPLVGKAAADAGADPQVVLVSTAKRTRETWALAAPFFPKAEVRFVDRLYLADPDVIVREVEAAAAERVMVLAHNPGLHDLASRLAHRMTDLDAKVRSKYPTAACAIFERRDETSSWRLKDFITPKNAVD